MKHYILIAFTSACITLISIGAWASTTANSKHSALSENDKIEYLINSIASSNANFVRNGSLHSSEKAKSHIEYKRNVAGKRIKTARQFIDMLASRSYFSGSPYYMELPSGKRVTARSWLMKQLYHLEETLQKDA